MKLQIQEAAHSMGGLKKVLGSYGFTRLDTTISSGSLREYYSKPGELKFTTESAELRRANGPS